MNTGTMNPEGIDPTGAYQRRLPEIVAVPDAALHPIGIDIVQAFITVCGALPEIRAFAAEIARLSDVDHALIAGLEDYAHAMKAANSDYKTTLHHKDPLSDLLEAAISKRELFRLDAAVLVKLGLMDAGQVAAFKNLVGFKNVGDDLSSWATLYQKEWKRIEERTALKREEIEEAALLSNRLLGGLGLREQAPQVTAAVAKIRHQALALLLRSYDETRRALTFLRWKEGDVDRIAPSLYASRRKHAQTSELAADAPAVTGTPTPSPVAPAPTDGNGAAHDLPFGVVQLAEVTQH